ncbi:protein of unknown function [Bartonella clarridgeiae 73]|uniref:Uncharacterized protein n=1 Tax=Bartonella clarridgeiae (strain CCUG 45776 / CIP 104772 / 73) TaxID=696125 RepID=E6YHX0_BARC7|nr:hypothetical protein [Bartonella clarridgeiae]WCR54968.1 MAG: hypothetical protein PG977_000361 [Bartonella clarridgeiae]CBI76458.1 protein of unknown function [Bartonella clarridgeiae 73]
MLADKDISEDKQEMFNVDGFAAFAIELNAGGVADKKIRKRQL